MSQKLALIHTSASLLPVFQNLTRQYLQDKPVSTFNIVDESLLQNTIDHNELSPLNCRRVVNYIASAEEAGADFVLVTCSSIGPAVDLATSLTSVPVFRVDQPMADEAVRLGRKIGIIATLATTLSPTCDLVRRRAEASGKTVKLNAKLCDGAFEALMSGSSDKHDQMVKDALKALAREVDVIVLAQASMARVVNQLDEKDKQLPILSSPELAMRHLADKLLD